jgi:hypothetical protein
MITNYLISKKRKELKEKQRKEEEKLLYLDRPFEEGDIVIKPKTNKKGTVLRIPSYSGQVVVLWDKTRTPQYEFIKELKISKESLNKNKKNGKYCVVSFGNLYVPEFFESYEEAELEAKNLFVRTQQKTFVLKTVAVVENQNLTISKLNKKK